MASSMDDLRADVAALREQVTMEAGLRASQDRELSELAVTVRAQTLVVQAMAATQIEHGALLRDHTVRLSRIERDVQELRTGMAAIKAMIQTLIDRGE